MAKFYTQLTKKKVIWKWKEEQKTAFENLKQFVTLASILKQAEQEKPYVLRTDATAYALGAVFFQREGNNECSVEYASRLLTEAEKNYKTTKREALALV